MEKDSKSVNESLTILEKSAEWDEYLSSEEALLDELSKERKTEPTYLELKPDSKKFKLPFNIFIIMFLCSLFRWENAQFFDKPII